MEHQVRSCETVLQQWVIFRDAVLSDCLHCCCYFASADKAVSYYIVKIRHKFADLCSISTRGAPSQPDDTRQRHSEIE